MKIWAKVKLKDYDRDIDIMSNSMANYLCKGPLMEVLNKYGLRIEDKRAIEEYTTSRIAGLLTLYMAKDQRRIKDIINRYYREDNYKRVMPEIEGYIDTNKN